MSKDIFKDYESFDFGFTAVSEEEYNSQVKQKEQLLEREQISSQQKVEELEKIIMPLLVNLLKTADREYIHWPNREKQLKEMIDRVANITRNS